MFKITLIKHTLNHSLQDFFYFLLLRREEDMTVTMITEMRNEWYVFSWLREVEIGILELNETKLLLIIYLLHVACSKDSLLIIRTNFKKVVENIFYLKWIKVYTLVSIKVFYCYFLQKKNFICLFLKSSWTKVNWIDQWI